MANKNKPSGSPIKSLVLFLVGALVVLFALMYAAGNSTDTRSRADGAHAAVKSWHFEQSHEGWQTHGDTASETEKGVMHLSLHEDTPIVALQSSDEHFIEGVPVDDKAFVVRLSATHATPVLGAHDEAGDDHFLISLIPEQLRHVLASYLSHGSLPQSVRDIGHLLSPESQTDSHESCAQIVQSAYDPHSATCTDFPSPCAVPLGWVAVGSCAQAPAKPIESEHRPLVSFGNACPMVIQPAYDPNTQTCRDFPSPCDVPGHWVKVDHCAAVANPTRTSTPTPALHSADRRTQTQNCASGVQPAYHPQTGQCHTFASGCAVPSGWNHVRTCDDSPAAHIVVPTNTQSQSHRPTTTPIPAQQPHTSPTPAPIPPVVSLHVVSGTRILGESIVVPVDGRMHEYKLPVHRDARDITIALTRTNHPDSSNFGSVDIAIDWIKLVGSHPQTTTPQSTVSHNSTPTPSAVAHQPTACIRTGCSGQICADREVMTTCEFRDEYSCYQNATCARQANGQCGWSQNHTVTSCIDQSRRTNTNAH